MCCNTVIQKLFDQVATLRSVLKNFVTQEKEGRFKVLKPPSKCTRSIGIQVYPTGESQTDSKSFIPQPPEAFPNSLGDDLAKVFPKPIVQAFKIADGNVAQCTTVMYRTCNNKPVCSFPFRSYGIVEFDFWIGLCWRYGIRGVVIQGIH